MNEYHSHYSMLIEWSEADQAYLVTLPEWADRVIMPATHGSTYGEAVQHGQEVLEMLVNMPYKTENRFPTKNSRTGINYPLSTPPLRATRDTLPLAKIGVS
jgi:predicted RNase H-like HicB family nuclease